MIRTICVTISTISATQESGKLSTYIRSFLLIFGRQNIPKHIDRGIGFNGNAGLHALLVDKSKQFLWTRRLGCGISWVGTGDGVDGRLVVEAVEIASGFLEIPNPFMRLMNRRALASEFQTRLSWAATTQYRDDPVSPLQSSYGSQRSPCRGDESAG